MMATEKANKSGTANRVGAAAMFFAMAFGMGGCVYVEAEPSNSAPYISDALVDVGFDTYYGECYWDFWSWVDDRDGYNDVRNVYVDVVDLVYGGIAETFNLAYDGNGQWSDTIYYTYSGYADCYFPYDFGFDFYAFDYYGEYDVLSF